MSRKITEKGLANHVSDEKIILHKGKIEFHGKLAKNNGEFMIESSYKYPSSRSGVPCEETFTLKGGEHLELLTNVFYQSGDKKVFCHYEFHKKAS